MGNHIDSVRDPAAGSGVMRKICEKCGKEIKFSQSYTSYNYAVRNATILYSHTEKEDCYGYQQKAV